MKTDLVRGCRGCAPRPGQTWWAQPLRAVSPAVGHRALHQTFRHNAPCRETVSMQLFAAASLGKSRKTSSHHSDPGMQECMESNSAQWTVVYVKSKY